MNVRRNESPWAGATIDDRYEVGEQLGSGAMAFVHRAVDTRLDRDVAIKILRTEHDGSEHAKRLFREAKSAARVIHPGTIAMYDVGQVGDAVYVVMELLEGQPLDKLLRREKRLPYPFVMDAARQAAEALTAIHKAGIVHRDIKPENMFVVESSSGALIKLLDFSIAKLSEELETQQLTLEGSVIGSAYYMAPEQVRANPVSARTDIYALGCVIYECIVGVPPFDAERLVDLWSKHLISPPPRITDVLPAVPEGLSALVVQMLSKSAEDRPQTAAEVAHRLAELLDTQFAPAGLQRRPKAVTQTERYSADNHPPGPPNIPPPPPMPPKPVDGARTGPVKIDRAEMRTRKMKK